VGTAICGVDLDFCVWNASGPLCSTSRQLEALERSDASVVQSKSATYSERLGNPMPRYAETELASINSEGLPNKGINYYVNCASEIRCKPYVVSISGLKPGENEKMIKRINQSDEVAWVEINLSCPNIPGKPLVAYDFDQLEQALTKLVPITKHAVGVKLPPYFDMNHYETVANILNRFPISFVVCCNTMGNGLIIDPKTDLPVIAPKGGLGGIAGASIKPTAMANVRMFRTLLKNDIDIIGAGGVSTGRDVYDYILCGASAVQVATQFRKEGPKLFARLKKELKEVMAARGYTKLSDFKNSLRSRI